MGGEKAARDAKAAHGANGIDTVTAIVQFLSDFLFVAIIVVLLLLIIDAMQDKDE